MTRIVIDAMGGDFAPKQQVLGSVDALNKDKDLYLILCGDETQIKAELAKKLQIATHSPVKKSRAEVKT